ncbi:MAG TPA: carbamate kinase [Clostridia bacterium]|nr:carbamate kinase [Clostridia bacterium]
MARIVIALGGNALQSDPKDISAKAQQQTIESISGVLTDLIEKGHEILFVHGNGPQVGQIMSSYETSATVNPLLPVMPFPECGAMSQGYIGYHLQQTLKNAMVRRGIKKEIVTIITQTVVDKNDPAFQRPSKPVGSFYTKEQAKELETTRGYVMKEDANRGYRRVVPSPKPLEFVEEPIISALLDAGHLVISAGGGGVPVIDRGNGELEGVPAVIDKDFAACKLAEDIHADALIILTAVDNVAVNFGRPDQKNLTNLTVSEAEAFIAQGQFAPGSMLPKVEAAISFVKSEPNRKAVITSLCQALEAIGGKAGTVVTI